MTIADRIRSARNELQLSQTELAGRAGYCDKTRISKIENAGNDISMKQIKRIAVALGVSTNYLMGWESHSAISEPSVAHLVDKPEYNFDYSNEEKEVIEAYRRIDNTTKKNIRLLLGLSIAEKRDIG